MGAGQLEEIMDKKTGTATLEGNRQIKPVKKDPEPEEEAQKEQEEITTPTVEFQEPNQQEPDKEQMIAEKLPLNTTELIEEPIPQLHDSGHISLSSTESTQQPNPLHVKLNQVRESLTESMAESKNPSTIGIDSIIVPHNQTSSKEGPETRNMEIKEPLKKPQKDLKHKHKAGKHKQEVPKKSSQDSTISQQSDNKSEKSDEVKKVPKRRAHSESHRKSSGSTNSAESGKIHQIVSEESYGESIQSQHSGGKLSEPGDVPQTENIVTEMPIEENELLLVEKYGQESDADTLYEDPLAPPSVRSSVSTISLDDGLKIKASGQKESELANKNKRVSHDLISKPAPVKPTNDNVVVLKARNKDIHVSSENTKDVVSMSENSEDAHSIYDRKHNESLRDEQVEIFKQGYQAQHKKTSSTPALFHRKTKR